ncbi:MAG: glycosyltransferase [Faecalibacterium sp.]|jgi:dolichol-phosphate mannosyltransferase|nr:glycosyltransferase [Faecalibacterium sp.]
MNAEKTYKEQNFVSAVVYLHNDEQRAVPFLRMLDGHFAARFAHYEIVAVDDRCTDGTVAAVKEWAKALAQPLTIVHMSLYQGVEGAMNAGLDCAIGDYVYEFDCPEAPWPEPFIEKAYDAALHGSDIVSVCPTVQRGSSKLFYALFNANSHSAYALRTDAFRLVSRRAVNRVHAVSEKLPYRKAAYAASGLKMETLPYTGKAPCRGEGRFGLAVDSLALYTDAGYKFSVGLTGAMLVLALAELVYTLAIYFGGRPIEGWTTMMFVLTVGFFGVFAVLAIVCKYLSLILALTFKKQTSLVEGIEKIQK